MDEGDPTESDPFASTAPDPHGRRFWQNPRLLAAVATAVCLIGGTATFAFISTGGPNAKAVRVLQGGTSDTTVAGSTPDGSLPVTSTTDIPTPSSTDQTHPTTTVSPYPPCTASQLTSTLTVNKTFVVPGDELIVTQTYQNIGPECTPQTAKAPPLLWELTSVSQKGQEGVGYDIFPTPLNPVNQGLYNDLLLPIPNPLPTGVWAKNSTGWNLGCPSAPNSVGPPWIPSGTYQFHDTDSWNPPPVSYTYDDSSCASTSTTTSTSTTPTSSTSTTSTTSPSNP